MSEIKSFKVWLQKRGFDVLRGVRKGFHLDLDTIYFVSCIIFAVIGLILGAFGVAGIFLGFFSLGFIVLGLSGLSALISLYFYWREEVKE